MSGHVGADPDTVSRKLLGGAILRGEEVVRLEDIPNLEYAQLLRAEEETSEEIRRIRSARSHGDTRKIRLAEERLQLILRERQARFEAGSLDRLKTATEESLSLVREVAQEERSHIEHLYQRASFDTQKLLQEAGLSLSRTFRQQLGASLSEARNEAVQDLGLLRNRISTEISSDALRVVSKMRATWRLAIGLVFGGLVVLAALGVIFAANLSRLQSQAAEIATGFSNLQVQAADLRRSAESLERSASRLDRPDIGSQRTLVDDWILRVPHSVLEEELAFQREQAEQLGGSIGEQKILGAARTSAVARVAATIRGKIPSATFGPPNFDDLTFSISLPRGVSEEEVRSWFAGIEIAPLDVETVPRADSPPWYKSVAEGIAPMVSAAGSSAPWVAVIDSGSLDTLELTSHRSMHLWDGTGRLVALPQSPAGPEGEPWPKIVYAFVRLGRTDNGRRQLEFDQSWPAMPDLAQGRAKAPLHGTKVAVVIGGRRAGVAPDCNILIVQAEERWSERKAALEFVLSWDPPGDRSQVDIVCMPWDLRTLSAMTHLELAKQADQLFSGRVGWCFVAAAGERGDTTLPPLPATAANVISAGALDQAGKEWSNGWRSQTKPDCYVPGVGFNLPTLIPNDPREPFSGTSAACAFLCGLLARSPSLGQTIERGPRPVVLFKKQ